MATGPVFDFVPSGEGAWRLYTRRAGELVAYVELVASGRYEVVWIVGAHGIQMFDSSDAIMDAATALLSAEEDPRSTRVAPAPRPAALRTRSTVA